MKPGHFKKKKGSSYYSSVQVGSGLSRFVDNFPFFSLPRTMFRNYCYILWILVTRKQALFTLNNYRWQNGKKKVHLSVLLIRPPAWMFLAGENKQRKAASVIQDTKENIVKHVSSETVLEKLYFRRCQTKYTTTSQLGTPILLMPIFEDKPRQFCSSLRIGFSPILNVLTGEWRLVNPSRLKLISFFSYQRLIFQSAWSFL